MACITDASVILPGKVLYHVYGGNKNPELSKRIITSKPSSTGRFNFICLYFSRTDNTMHEYHSHGYLRDNGIGAGYNLNRMFITESDALEFVLECFSGEFSTEHNRLAAERLEANKADMEYWDY